MTERGRAASAEPKKLDCPSAPISAENARVFGVVLAGEQGPEVQYLEAPVPVTDEVLALSEGLPPMEVFRTVSRCAESKCQHFSGDSCNLGARLARTLEPVSEELPPCSIRTTCRWFSEQGVAACLRCPQVVTDRPVLVRSDQADVRKLRRQLPVV